MHSHRFNCGRETGLASQLTEEFLVNSVEAWTYNPGNPGLFGLSAVVDAEKFSSAREAILAEFRVVAKT